ncbi:MAG: hypothetical protein HYS07_01750 [Chlamydiae bacterium]|nr:hypothetical protein [Chlamydiota bacterium]MBI3277285.1 hypothetical protein [Chlamydiota bacterium]
MISKSHINVTIDQSILRWIDAFRGQTPRSTFINQLLSSLSRKSKAIFDWGLEEHLAAEDIKHGRVNRFNNAKDAVRWLKSR